MIGAIIGDIVGSIYEFDNHKSKKFTFIGKDCTFTDDTVMTIAIADFITDDNLKTGKAVLISIIQKWYKKYPNMTYGAKFTTWLKSIDSYTQRPYNSYGNGAAMRISAIGGSVGTIESAVRNSYYVTEITHNHSEGMKGASAVASLMVMARTEKDKKKLKEFIEWRFDYDLGRTVAELKKTYKYNETCQRTVPEAIICFLESKNFEDAIRNAISIGGDSDTLACITGGIAEAYYQDIPVKILKDTLNLLPDDIKAVVFKFYRHYDMNYPKIAKSIENLK